MHTLSRVLIGAAVAFAGGYLATGPQPAFAQSSANVGALRGVIKDKAGNEPAVGATVVATSPALVAEQVVITDENGQYFITSLPPGLYTLTIYYADKEFQRSNALVQLGKEAVVNVTVDSSLGKPTGGEVIEIQGTVPIIDQGSTKTGVVLTEDYTRNIPVGRTFGAVIGAAAGAQTDAFGTSIAGATSAENVFVVDGINTTDTGFGGQSLNLPNEFVSETEVIAGGYNAEFGRATGGIVNVVTKSGSNQFHGSVFGTLRPGALIDDARVIETEGSSIEAKTDLDYAYDVGAEIGGPIIKDKLWFHVGINPSVTKQTVSRFIRSQVDADMDGAPDVNEAGNTLREDVASNTATTLRTTYFYTAKINGAINQNNQFQISMFGNPRNGESPLGVNRDPGYTRLDAYDGAYDVAAKWTSKFNEGKTQIDAVAGFHRQVFERLPQAGQNVPFAFYAFTRSLADFADIEGGQAVAACEDGGPNDPYPMMRNCPVVNYASQGIGFLQQRTNDRTSAVLAVTQRVKALGYHTFKAGIDGDFSTFDARRGFTGGAFMLRGSDRADGTPGLWQVQRLMRVKRNLEPGELADPSAVALDVDDILCADGRAICEVARDGITADTNNTSVAAFLQDSWQLRPNLTLNFGLRWEQQTGYVAEALQGDLSPQGEVIPETAYKLTNMLSPRVAFIYDPTKEGKSKVYGHWGRFYENVPMDINVRAFGGEITDVSLFNANRRKSDAVGYDPNCDVNYTPGDPDLSARLLRCQDRAQLQLLGEGTEFVSPGLEGQYTQELILGTEYQVLPNFKVGLAYTHRSMPQVIEDISTDGGASYMITNPGEDFSDAAADQRARAAQLMATGDPDDAALAEVVLSRAAQLDYVSKFDKPVRNYDAVVLSAIQRPTRQSLLQATYTYSVSKGNFPGLFSTETNQLDPNLTSLYDLPDLMANRYGNLGLDRPHNLRIDGFYQFDLKKAGLLTTGASVRAQSGIAHNALGGHPVYGLGESYLLPRGAIARSPVTAELDLQLGYGRRLGKTTVLEAFVRVFNVSNQQEELDIDENYTFDDAQPIVGGDREDLRHAKSLTGGNVTVEPNRNFGRTNARQFPRSMQLGARLIF